MNSESHLRDQDLVRWIENKLGSNELWGGRKASSMLTKEILVELETCFQELEPATKMKIIQAMAHLSPKILQSWKEPLLNLLELARRDPDDWVEAMADIFQKFPDRGCIQCSTRSDSYLSKTQIELSQIVTNVIEQSSENFSFPLPPDSAFMTSSAIKATYGCDDSIHGHKHFTMRKQNTKFDKLLDDLKKASEQQNNPANRKTHGLISSFPIKIRSTAKKLNNNLPMKGLSSTNNALKMSAGFSNDSKKFQQRMLPKREGGAQLIEIAELPQGNRRRRNAPSASEDPQSTKSNSNSTGKRPLEKLSVPPSPLKMSKRKQNNDNKNNMKETTTENNRNINNKGKMADEENIQMTEETATTSQQQIMETEAANDVFGTHQQQQQWLQTPSADGNLPFPSGFASTFADPDQQRSSSSVIANTNSLNPLADEPKQRTVNRTEYIQNPPSCFNNLFVEIGEHSQTHQNDSRQNNATSELLNFQIPENAAMKQFKSLLNDANKLSPTSYNMILAFLNGNKSNPLQDKLGAIITLPLSESVELESTGQGVNAFLIETFFQMNYYTGEWKRLRKSRLLKPEEIGHYSSYLQNSSQIFGPQQSQHGIEPTLAPLSTSSSDSLVPNFGGQLFQQQQQMPAQHNYWPHSSQQQHPFGHPSYE